MTYMWTSEIHSFQMKTTGTDMAFFAAAWSLREKVSDMPADMHFQLYIWEMIHVKKYGPGGGHYYVCLMREKYGVVSKYLDSEKGLTFVSYYVGKFEYVGNVPCEGFLTGVSIILKRTVVKKSSEWIWIITASSEN